MFDNGYDKNKNLWYKAFIRRALALRGQRDYKLAKVDIESALKLYCEEKDALKLQALNDEDIELEERIQSIMQQRDGLSDKEFIDFTLSYLRGQKDEEIKIEEGKTESSFCMHPIGEDDGDKLIKLLKKSDDLLLYFIKLKGLMVLRDSFSYNNVGFKVLEQILQKNDKVKEEFQKVKGYEAMIDYLHNRSLSPEKVSLDSDIVYQVFNMQSLD